MSSVPDGSQPSSMPTLATLDALVTDDFHLVGPYGFVLDKQQWLDRYRSGDFVTTAMTWHDVERARLRRRRRHHRHPVPRSHLQGTPSNGDFRITHVFVRADDRWAIAGMQLSPTSFTLPEAAHTQEETS